MYRESYRAIYFFLILIIIASCEKESSELTIIKGNLTDFFSGKPVSEYEIYVEKQNFNLFGAHYIVIDTIYSNASGGFQYTFYNENIYSYYVSAGENYHYTAFEQLQVELKTTNDYEIVVKPLHTVELELVNKTHQYKEFQIENLMLKRERFNDTIIYLEGILPTESLRLLIWLYKNSEIIEEKIGKEVDLVIDKGDTTYIRLEY